VEVVAEAGDDLTFEKLGKDRRYGKMASENALLALPSLRLRIHLTLENSFSVSLCRFETSILAASTA